MITTNMGLKLPHEDDFYNIDDFNDNFNHIERAVSGLTNSLGEANTRVSGVENTVTSIDNRDTMLIQALTNKVDILESKLDSLRTRYNVSSSLIIEQCPFPGSFKGICSSSISGTQKLVSIQGFTLTDGVTFGVVFVNANTNIAPTLRVNNGSETGEDLEMWNEKGRVGIGNQVIAEYPTMMHVFQYNRALHRYIWIMAMKQ